MNRNTLTVLFTFVLALGCFALSGHYSSESEVAMAGFQDCSWVHSIPGPANCADNNLKLKVDTLEFKSSVFLLIGLAFILGLATVPIIIERRCKESVADTSDSVKIVS